MRIVKIGRAWLAQMERASLCMLRARLGAGHIFVLTNAAHDFCPARFVSAAKSLGVMASSCAYKKRNRHGVFTPCPFFPEVID
jgi:hypothetical protein